MEEILNGEQLETPNKDENGAIMQSEEMVQDLENTGSPLSKFKNFSELEKAYVNLEREFTKKCQQLKDLKEHSCDNVVAPQQLECSFKDAKEFFESNPSAKQFADEIMEVIESDKASLSNPLENALNFVKAKHYKSNEELLSDESFIEDYVLKNSKIQQKIIGDYLQNIISNKSMPLMSDGVGASMLVTPKHKPKSLKEAGDYMVALIGNK